MNPAVSPSVIAAAVEARGCARSHDRRVVGRSESLVQVVARVLMAMPRTRAITAGEVDCRDLQSELRRAARHMRHLRRSQRRLTGGATEVHAGAAEIVAFGKRHPFAGAHEGVGKGECLPARRRAQDIVLPECCHLRSPLRLAFRRRALVRAHAGGDRFDHLGGHR
jgi:hypothetical protein